MTKKRYDAADQKDIDAQILKEQVITENKLRNWSAVMNTRAGLEVLREIMEACQVYTSIFTGNSATFYNAGKHDLGTMIMNTVDRAFFAGGIRAEQVLAFRLTRLEQDPKDEQIVLGKKPRGDFFNFFDNEEVGDDRTS